MTQFSNPRTFQNLARPLLCITAIITCICFSVGLYIIFWKAPLDYQQGITVRIMYVHVPASWLAMSIYGLMGVSSFIYCVWRHTLAVMIAKAAAPVGATFALCSLITGSLWGKPMWGTWWVWDARLTSMFMLFLLYSGYILIHKTTENSEKAYFASSIIAMMGLINLPIIKFSVDWWHTLHQPASILRSGGPSIHSSMLIPLFVMMIGFTTLSAFLIIFRTQTEILEQKLQARYRRLVLGEGVRP